MTDPPGRHPPRHLPRAILRNGNLASPAAIGSPRSRVRCSQAGALGPKTRPPSPCTRAFSARPSPVTRSGRRPPEACAPRAAAIPPHPPGAIAPPLGECEEPALVGVLPNTASTTTHPCGITPPTARETQALRHVRRTAASQAHLASDRRLTPRAVADVGLSGRQDALTAHPIREARKPATHAPRVAVCEARAGRERRLNARRPGTQGAARDGNRRARWLRCRRVSQSQAAPRAERPWRQSFVPCGPP